MSETNLLPCPFCGTVESARDGVKGTSHKEDCYLILMETELPNSPLRIMAWNTRTQPDVGSEKKYAFSKSESLEDDIKSRNILGMIEKMGETGKAAHHPNDWVERITKTCESILCQLYGDAHIHNTANHQCYITPQNIIKQALHSLPSTRKK